MFQIRPFSFARNAALALTVLAGAAGAQDLDVKVQTDPRAGLAIYDFRFQGPPRGFSALFVSPFAPLNPFPIPGIGAFELDPFRYFQLGVIPMNDQGQANLRLPLPLPLVQQGIGFQPLFVDTSLNLRLTSARWLDAICENRESNGPTCYSGSWSFQDGKYRFKIGNVNLNDNISIAVNNQPVFATHAKAAGPLEGCFRHPSPFRRGTRIDVFRNNQLWMSIVR